MLKEFTSIQATIDGNVVEVQGFAFQPKNGDIQLVPGSINTTPDDSHLLHCTCIWFLNHAIIRTGKIDTSQKAKELQILFKHVQQETQRRGFNAIAPYRTSVLQLNLPDVEWDYIRLQHYHLEKNQLKCAHINFPSESFFRHANEESRTILMQKTINKLCRQLNAEGWLHYSDWLNKDLDTLYKTLQYDALDEYQVEASIKDFAHEMASTLLLQDRKEAEELILDLGDQEFAKDISKQELSYQQLLDHEKRLLKKRFDMQANLKHQKNVLEDAVGKISKIEKLHPEFVSIKHIVVLLKSLIAVQTDFMGDPLMSWGQQLMLLGLLDLHLGVITAINGGLQPALDLAIKLGIVQLMRKYQDEQIINLALTWDKSIAEINKEIGIEGAKGVNLSPKAKLVVNLRYYVWENLRLLKVPSGGLSIHEGLLANERYLQFLPAYEEGTAQPIVSYNNESGVPVSLTDYGFRQLKSL